MKYAAILVVLFVAGCTGTTAPVGNETFVNNNSAGLSEMEMNEVSEQQFLENRKEFIGPSNELYDVEVLLTTAGRINISENGKTSEYFRVDFHVTNHENRDIEFPYSANITEGNFPSIKISSSDEKRPLIEVLKPNETKEGYVLFKNYHPQNSVVELTIAGGYRQFSTSSTNFRFKIAFQNESSVNLERVTLDFNEEGNVIHPGAFLLVKVPSNATYRYLLKSERNVTVEVWPPGTKVNTIQFTNSTYNSTCSAKQQISISKECTLETNYIITIRRTTNAKTYDLGGTVVSFHLFKTFIADSTPGTIKYTGQVTLDGFKDSEEVFVVL